MASDDRTAGPRVETFSRWITAIPHYAVLLLVWPVVWGGSAVSIWLAYRTGQFAWRYLFILTHDNFQELLSGLLHCIELLLLIPLPVSPGSSRFAISARISIPLQTIAGRLNASGRWRSGSS